MPPRPGQAPPAPQPLPGVDAIVAVGSGKGGVGKTTLAVNLALAFVKLGHKTGLLDADVYGPNVPLMLGTSAQPKVVGENRIVPLDVHGLKVISVGLLNPGDKPLIWRGPMLHSIIRQFLSSVEWGTLDYLIVDLPPGTGGADQVGCARRGHSNPIGATLHLINKWSSIIRPVRWVKVRDL